MEKDLAEKLALDLIRQHNLIEYNFQWTEGKRIFGYCNYNKKIIGLSLPLTELNSEEEVKDTILHEIAHALAGKGTGHGNKWKEMCLKIGAKPERCWDKNNVKEPEGKYIVSCSTCGYVRQAHRKKKKVACGKCCRTYNGGKYSTKYLLEYKLK